MNKKRNKTPLTRTIKPEVIRELWARAAGRCQFQGCNRLLYKSPITQENVNIAEQAHIYSFSPGGPRGRGPFENNPIGLNDVSNLMLLCHDCHKLIDQDKDGTKYSATLLRQWKNEHEQRVRMVTGITSNVQSHVIFYCSNIGESRVFIQLEDAATAMFPDSYPSKESPIDLSMRCSLEDNSNTFWKACIDDLEKNFNLQILPLIEKNLIKNFSLFALAPMPLLIKLGTLFNDKYSINTYQPIREPKGWRWRDFPDGFEFIVREPNSFGETPVLIISLSDIINPERVKAVLGENISVWELTVPESFIGNDNIRHKDQLSMMRKKVRELMIMIKQKHGQNTPLSVFPAMSVSCAIEMGRVRMPKADMPWIIYDQNNKEGQFIETITIS